MVTGAPGNPRRHRPRRSGRRTPLAFYTEHQLQRDCRSSCVTAAGSPPRPDRWRKWIFLCRGPSIRKDMGLKVVNVYRASLPQRYFPLFPPLRGAVSCTTRPSSRVPGAASRSCRRRRGLGTSDEARDSKSRAAQSGRRADARRDSIDSSNHFRICFRIARPPSPALTTQHRDDSAGAIR